MWMRFFLWVMRSFFLCGDIFSLSFQLFQFDNYSIEESGHCREVERRVNVCHVWTVRPKKTTTKMARVERWPLRKRWTLVLRFDSISHDTTVPQFFLEFGELKIATNCTAIKHSYTDWNQWGNTTEYWKAILFAARVMPFFENCCTVASYIFAWTLLAEFSFQRHF